MSKFDLRPAVANYKCSNGSGRDAERIFREECERRGIFYGKVGEENDIGIDVITYCIDEQGKKIYKNVQITIASKQTHPKTYLVNKKIRDIRSDIDIIAIYVPYKSTQPEQANINTGEVGDHGFWFLYLLRYTPIQTCIKTIAIPQKFGRLMQKKIQATY